VLSNKSVVKPSDAATLDMKDEYWSLMSELLPVLQPLQIVTELLSAESTPVASLVYPLMWKLVSVDLADKADDIAAVKSVKGDLRRGINDRFKMTDQETANHPFVVATVLDPATKAIDAFPDQIKVQCCEVLRY